MDEAYQLTDENGAPVTEWQDSKSSFGQPFQFGGAWTDDESGYIWMRHRFYDSRMRGFLSRDPVEEFPLRDIYQTYALTDPTMTGSLGNLYAFAENNPGSFIDPLGLGVWDDLKAKSDALKKKVKAVGSKVLTKTKDLGRRASHGVREVRMWITNKIKPKKDSLISQFLKNSKILDSIPRDISIAYFKEQLKDVGYDIGKTAVGKLLFSIEAGEFLGKIYHGIDKTYKDNYRPYTEQEKKILKSFPEYNHPYYYNQWTPK